MCSHPKAAPDFPCFLLHDWFGLWLLYYVGEELLRKLGKPESSLQKRVKRISQGYGQKAAPRPQESNYRAIYTLKLRVSDCSTGNEPQAEVKQRQMT